MNLKSIILLQSSYTMIISRTILLSKLKIKMKIAKISQKIQNDLLFEIYAFYE